MTLWRRVSEWSFDLFSVICSVISLQFLYLGVYSLSAAFSLLSLFILCPCVEVEVQVTLRLTVSQSVNIVVEPHLGLMTRYIFLSDNYCLAFLGRPLWREDGSVFCLYSWPRPVPTFSTQSPMGLATVFYCLRFETSLFVAFYDSQGHGEVIRPLLHTGVKTISSQSQSHIATDGQSLSKSWCRAPFGAYDQIFSTVRQLRSCFFFVGRLLWREEGSVFCQSHCLHQ
jgi:hypothetical protein